MPTLSLTLDGANGEAHDWNDCLVPFNEIKALLNTTKIDYLNAQTNGFRTTNLRSHADMSIGRQKIRNDTGSTLTTLQIVAWNGTYSDGTDSYPKVVLADANTALTTHKSAAAVVEANIADDADGTVVLVKEFSGVDTSGATVGDPIYLSTSAGGWTRTAPTGGEVVQVIGRVTVVHASTGRWIFQPEQAGVYHSGTSAYTLPGALSVTGIDMVANTNRIDLDTDNDTSIRASADDTIMFEIAGADDFSMTANSLNVLSGSALDLADNAPVQFGDADDASIKWDASNLAVSAGTAAVNITAGDVAIYDDNNGADVSLTMGTGSAESFSITVDNGSGNKTAEEIKFTSKTASGTADHGKIGFYVDEVKIGTFDDGGLDLESGKVFSVNGSTVVSSVIDSIANGADNRIVTFSDSDSLNGEANLEFDGSTLSVNGSIDMVAHNNRIDLDVDNDTSIRASADDTISIEVAGADDFTITANSFNVLTGSVIDLADNAPVQFGDADDASIKWDTADLAIAAGSADVKITASNVIPATNDGSALGVSGTAWSDLFLASGSVVDFHAGDVTLTHSSNTLTVAGGTLATAALTASGTLTANSDVVVNDDSNNRLLLLDNDGTGTALEITQDAVAASTDYALHVHSTVAQTSGELVWIDHDHASSTSDVMRLRNDGTGHTAYLTQNGVLASNKYGLHVYSDAAQTNEGLALFKLDNASSNKPVIEVIQDGAGPAIQVEQNTHSQPVILVESATASGGTAAAGAAFHSGYIESIGANSTATIWSGRNIQSGFMILCIYDGNSGDNSTALIEFSTHSSAYEGTIMSQSGDDTIAITTSDVSGSTGTSGQFTVSIRAGIIEFENRLHAVDNTRVGWWIFSH